MNRNLYDLIGLAAAVCFILALKGLSHPKTARRGNLIGAFGATVATLLVFFFTGNKDDKNYHALPLHHLPLILGALVLGLLVGVPAARKVQMTQMPQLVALFNGVGGGAAALVAIVEYLKLGTWWTFTSLWCSLRTSSRWSRCSNCYLTLKRIHWFDCGSKRICSADHFADRCRNTCWRLRNNPHSLDG